MTPVNDWANMSAYTKRHETLQSHKANTVAGEHFIDIKNRSKEKAMPITQLVSKQKQADVREKQAHFKANDQGPNYL